MNPGPRGNLKSVLFIYSRSKGYAGQQAATDLVVRELTMRGYRVRQSVTRAFDRDKRGRWDYPFLLCQYVFAWCQALLYGFGSYAICLNLGQTRISMLREGIPFRVLARLRPRARRIVSLHGSLFMNWQPDDPLATQFIKVLRHAHVVTVLGPKQRQHLIELGVPADRVEILCNTSELPELGAGDLAAKFHTCGNGNPMRLLFLSNLIVSKGYLVYLKALRQLSQRSGIPPISAVLCGPLKVSEFSSNYNRAQEARDEIEQIIEETQQSGRIQVEWIEGARGEAKFALYRQAHIFVFPSQYPVEAQPLVLLEAMASGCAIITSTVGEIPFTMGDVGLLVDQVSDTSVADAIEQLATDSASVAAQAASGLDHYTNSFAVQAHVERWESLLEGSRS